MQELCLDASILVASVTPQEPGHQAAIELIQHILQHDIALFEPALVCFEVVSAVSRKNRAGDLTDDEASRVSDFLFQLPLLLQWQQDILERARRYARELSFKNIYDCTYLAVATGREIPLVTLDEELIVKGRRIFKQVYSPAEFLHL